MKVRRLLACLLLLVSALSLYAQDIDSLDVSFVLDASSSMEDGLLQSAQNASNQFIQLLEVGDEVAVSAYSNYAHTYYQMAMLTSPAQISSVTAAVNQIETDEYTSIGAGMIRGLLEMNDIVSVNPVVGMILLSDGLENYLPMVSQVIGAVPGIVQIHTIGYGVDCDQMLMAQIAGATGGTYHYANTGNITNILQEIYDELLCDDTTTMRTGNAIAGRNIIRQVPVTVHPGMHKILFNLCWTNPENEYTLKLISPSGQIYDGEFFASDKIENRTFDTQTFFRFYNPEPGEWNVLIEANTRVDGAYTFRVQGNSPLTLNYDFNRDIYMPGDEVVITADLSYDGLPVNNAQITAVVTRTDGSIYEFQLSESAFASAEGQYTGSFFADEADSYTVSLHASGVTSDGAFTRYTSKSCYVGEVTPLTAPSPIVPALSASNSPNPFNPTTSIRFSIPAEGPVELSIYNIRGQKVRTLVNETLTAGSHQAVWNGDDASGAPVGSGCYLYRITTSGETITNRMLLLK